MGNHIKSKLGKWETGSTSQLSHFFLLINKGCKIQRALELERGGAEKAHLVCLAPWVVCTLIPFCLIVFFNISLMHWPVWFLDRRNGHIANRGLGLHYICGKLLFGLSFQSFLAAIMNFLKQNSGHITTVLENVDMV